jgi:predicted component of type VI protein secretion system
MMIRLSIAAGTGAPTTFEHPGPMIRIGRDPACDLALRGEADDVASRHHARIELGAGRATLTDAGSSNGTLLNGDPLKGPARLRVGDQIQMGFTGALLTVLALDLNPTRPRKSGRRPRPLLIGSVTAALVVVVSGAMVFPRLAAKPVRPAASPPAALPGRAEPLDPGGKGAPPVPDGGDPSTPKEKPNDDNIPIPVPVPDEINSEKPQPALRDRPRLERFSR